MRPARRCGVPVWPAARLTRTPRRRRQPPESRSTERFRRTRTSRWEPTATSFWRPSTTNRNSNFEHCTAADIVRGGDVSAVSLDDGLDDGEPEAGVAMGGRVVGAVGEEAVEDAAEVFFRDAGTFVGDAHDDRAVLAPRCDDDALSVRREAHSVIQQIFKNLKHPIL